MDIFFAQLLNGLVYGVLLFLIAAGLSLIFGLMNVVSLAHGSFFMLGAFIGLSIFQITGSYWLALLLAPLPTAVIGIVIELIFLRRLYRRGHLDQVLLTFGFTFIFSDLVRTIWGSNVRSLPVPDFLRGSLVIGAGVFSVYRLFLIGFGFAMAGLLWMFLERSRLGAMVRAGVDDSTTAAGLGGNIPALFTGVFGVGVALAAVGGVAAGPILGLYPGMDADVLITAFIVIVIGGMGSLRGAFVGSLIVGIADTFGKAYLPFASLFLIYLVMAVVLLVRPQGLFGIRHNGTTSAPVPVDAHDVAAAPAIGRLATLAALAAMLLFPLIVTDYPVTLASEIYIFAILAMSLDLLVGYAGLMSLGHAAFFGLGAYAVVILSTNFGLNSWLGVAGGVVLAAAVSGLFGFFCVRARGITFLMLTLAASQLLYSIALKWRAVTGGSDGIGIADRASFFGWSLSNSLAMYYMAMLFFVASYLGLRRLIGSPLGQVFIGIRENESRMLAIGYATRSYKLLCFVLASTIAGFSGGLYALFNGFISPDAVNWSTSGDVLIMVMLGGIGSLIGPAIGAAIFLLMKNLVSSYSDHWMLIIGVIFVFCVMFSPTGIWGIVRRLRFREPAIERLIAPVSQAEKRAP